MNKKNIEDKEQQLRQILQEMQSVIIAFSGGVDSACLYKVAVEELNNQALGVTGRSPSVPRHDLEEVHKFVEDFQLPHLFIDTHEIEDENYQGNPTDRCFFCKDELYGRLNELCRKKNIQWIIDGTNADDPRDHRPGLKAARRQGVRSPLQEAGLSKEDVRRLSRKLNLPTWNKPASACLASRFPYGIGITQPELLQVDRCEIFLRGLGIGQLRVRHHKETARIEVMPEDFEKILKNREAIVNRFQEEGYHYITLDLKGFRSGSLNETLNRTTGQKPKKEKKKKEKPFIPKTFGEGIYTLYTDGGCTNNPGPGAWGYALFDNTGNEVARGNGFMKHTTNNVAEYQALIEGLTRARKHQVDKICVLSDSELLVRQMNGEYRIKHPDLKDKALTVLKIRRQFHQFQMQHVPRKQNWLADRLVGEILKKEKNKKRPAAQQE